MVKRLVWPALLLCASCRIVNGGGATVDGVENVNTVEMERTLPFAISEVWSKIFLDFGGVAKFHPHFEASDYLGDVRTAQVGAARYCRYADDEEKVIHERIVAFDEEKKMMRFQIYEAFDVPLDTANTFGTSQLIAVGENQTKMKIKLTYRTSPRYIAWFAHSQIEEDLSDMMIGIEHYLATGESVGPSNFDDIKEQYAEK